MPSAINTSLDVSIVNRVRSRAQAWHNITADRLEVMRRLRRQVLNGYLPRCSESNVEQSWNEQLFSKLFGYSSQFSHAGSIFHMRAKNYQGGYFSDFSLGFFGPKTDRVLASAELKGPGTDLDRPQGTKYGNLTPVEQAFRTARRSPTCMWVLVSNFHELRLYTVQLQTPLVVADLAALGGLRDLALLVGLFHRQSLLGDHRRAPELTSMLTISENEPAALLDASPDRFRLIARFTPLSRKEMPLFRAEQILRAAALSAPDRDRFIDGPGYGIGPDLQVRFADGWLSMDGTSSCNDVATRVAVSILGEVEVCLRIPTGEIRVDNAPHPYIEFNWLKVGLHFFAALVGLVHDLTTVPGLFIAELRDVTGAYMNVDSQLLAPGAPNSGVATSHTIVAGDFRWDCTANPVTYPAALCACELAAHFRRQAGGIGVHFDLLQADIAAFHQRCTAQTP